VGQSGTDLVRGVRLVFEAVCWQLFFAECEGYPLSRLRIAQTSIKRLNEYCNPNFLEELFTLTMSCFRYFQFDYVTSSFQLTLE